MSISLDTVTQSVAIVSQAGSIILLGAWVVNRLIIQPLQNSIDAMKEATRELKDLLSKLSEETKDIDKRLVAVEQITEVDHSRLDRIEERIA